MRSAVAVRPPDEARLFYVDDKTLLYLAEVLKVQVQEVPAKNARIDFTNSWRNWKRRDSDRRQFAFAISKNATVRSIAVPRFVASPSCVGNL